jgi:hypothetical protein
MVIPYLPIDEKTAESLPRQTGIEDEIKINQASTRKEMRRAMA